jgi:hypothetical protein
VPPALVFSQPSTFVVPAKVFAFLANTQPSMVPASVPLLADAEDMVKVSPAKMFPSNVIGPWLPTLIVAALLTIQKMLSACASPSKVNVIAPFTVKAPGIWIMKIAEGLS